MDKTLLNNTAKRLNVYDEYVVKKAEEYLRLYESKASLKTLNSQAKIVLCLDLASKSLGKGLDKEMVLSLCHLKKMAYQNNLNTLEKVLGLDKTLTVSDACIQLGCSAVAEDARDILSKYKNVDGKIKDLDHPQYVAAAIYLACRAKKISVDKPKVVSLSRLKPSQWKELINAFEKIGLGKSITKQGTKENVEDVDMVEVDRNELAKKVEFEEIEEYEVWKERILQEAYAALRNEQMREKDEMEHSGQAV